MPLVGNNVNINDVHKVLERAAKHILDARGNDPVASRADMAKKLGTLSGEEKALVDLFYRFTDHRDHKPGARITETDVQKTLEYAKRKLIERLDQDGDHGLSNDEIKGMSRIGKLAVALAQAGQAGGAGTTGGTGTTGSTGNTQGPQWSATITKALAAGDVSLVNGAAGEVTGVRVSNSWNSETKASALLDEVLKTAGAGSIDTVKLGLINEWDNGDTYGAALTNLAANGPYPNLKNLVVGDVDYPNDTEISWINVGDINGVFTAAPGMEDLHVVGSGVSFSATTHNNLKRLMFESGGLPKGVSEAIGKSDLPKLEELTFWFGSDEYGGPMSAACVDDLLASTKLPKLTKLGLQNAMFTDDLPAKLATSALLTQLTELDLSMGTMTDAGAQKLIDNKDKFKHLKKLNVDDNYLSPAMVQQLQTTFGSAIVSSRQDKLDDLDPSDPTWRYPSVTE
jgi:hypothetical protein